MVSIVDLFRTFRPQTTMPVRSCDNEIGRRLMEAASDVASSPPSAREISVHELGRLKDPLLVDVRGETEYVRGHIQGARNFDRSVFEQSASDILPDRAGPIVVYTSQGESSATRVEITVGFVLANLLLRRAYVHTREKT